MVRGIVKAPKKTSDGDVFQSTMGRVGAFVKENAFTIILSAAVIGAFVTYGIMKTSGTGKAAPEWMDVDTDTDPRNLLRLAEEHKGEPVAKVALLRVADLHFEEYQGNGAAYGDTHQLDEAEAIYRQLLERYGDDEEHAGFIFNVKYSLKKIEQERADIAAGKFPISERPVEEPESAEPPGQPSSSDGGSSESAATCAECGSELAAGLTECPGCKAPVGSEPDEPPKSP